MASPREKNGRFVMKRSEYRTLNPAEEEKSARSTIKWWDGIASDYLAEHGDFLGDSDLCWCPEGLRESEVHFLGELDHLRDCTVLEVGCGAAQGARWLRSQGVNVTASDAAAGMLKTAEELNEKTGITVPLVLADARELPFGDAEFDLVFTAFGAIPFVPDPQRIHAEVARILKPGGRWVFSTSHPMRWCFPDDPTLSGLTVDRSYFDRSAYAELDQDEQIGYAEHHHTLSDHLRYLLKSGLVLRDLIEPEWEPTNGSIWGGWGPERGKYFPGSLIIIAENPVLP